MPSKTSHDSILSLLERANQAAQASRLDDLLVQTLALLGELCAASSGLALLCDSQAGPLVCQAVMGLPGGEALFYESPLHESAFLLPALRQGQAQFFSPLPEAPLWATQVELLCGIPQSSLLAVPFMLGGELLCAALLFDCQAPPMDLLPMLTARLATEIHKSILLEKAELHGERMDAMISIFERIGSTLDRDRLLRMMIDDARKVINAEACSLFLVDEETGENVLHLASNFEKIAIEQVRVPSGKGIIGHVVQSGETVLVPDVRKDERHYRQVDQGSGFTTRAILAVPLRTRTVILGEERGVVSTRLIGGFEAINKVQGTFDDQDAGLLTTLANQAATVLQIADLYGDANQLFLDVIRALTAVIDAKDPYTQGHSQRVSDFSVEVARQMQLSPELIHRVRIGSLLHDVGKIGIPDQILSKPGRLTEDEFRVIRQHAAIGAGIMGQVKTLHAELPALAEHHERLDGSGYPKGLRGEQVSLMGRIVAVADVFDAMTSDRPYRLALPADQALEHLFGEVGSHFDGQCVNALARAYIKGSIQTQKEQQ